MKVYAIYYNGRLKELFETEAKAQEALKEITNVIQRQYGVRIITSKNNEFNYILGAWEETDCRYYIREMEIK